MQKVVLVRAWQACAVLVGVMLTLVSCASWPAPYLKAATNQAGMSEVEQHLGPPQATWELHTGETLWTYRVGSPVQNDSTAGVRIVGPGWVIGRPSACSEYALLFDQQQLLRAWRAQSCSAIPLANPSTHHQVPMIAMPPPLAG